MVARYFVNLLPTLEETVSLANRVLQDFHVPHTTFFPLFGIWIVPEIKINKVLIQSCGSTSHQTIPVNFSSVLEDNFFVLFSCLDFNKFWKWDDWFKVWIMFVFSSGFTIITILRLLGGGFSTKDSGSSALKVINLFSYVARSNWMCDLPGMRILLLVCWLNQIFVRMRILQCWTQ